MLLLGRATRTGGFVARVGVTDGRGVLLLNSGWRSRLLRYCGAAVAAEAAGGRDGCAVRRGANGACRGRFPPCASSLSMHLGTVEVPVNDVASRGLRDALHSHMLTRRHYSAYHRAATA